MRSLILLTLGALLSAPPAKPRPAPAARPEQVRLVAPNGLAVTPGGVVLVTDLATHRLVALSPQGSMRGLAGTGEPGFNGDGLPAVKARLASPMDVAEDRAGNILVADTYNHRIRRIDRRGIITTVVGSGKCGYSGDGGPAVKASLNNPQGIALAPDGTLYIADTYNHVVRRVDPHGTLSTFAGTEGGLAGDGGPATKAQISLPQAVAVAPDGSVYVSDSGNNRIRRVDASGIIETIAGTGPGSGTAGAGFAGDGGPAVRAKLFAAADVEAPSNDQLYISDSGNHRVRAITRGVIATILGTGMSGETGPGGEPLLSSPQKLALDARGNLYIADRANRRVLRRDGAGQVDVLRVTTGLP